MTRFSANSTDLWRSTYAAARRVAIAVFGTTGVLLGVVLVFTPGPAIVVIPLGLGILATEFLWARRLLRHLRERASTAWSRLAGKNNPPSTREISQA